MNIFRAPEQNKTYCNMLIYENGERSKAAQIPKPKQAKQEHYLDEIIKFSNRTT